MSKQVESECVTVKNWPPKDLTDGLPKSRIRQMVMLLWLGEHYGIPQQQSLDGSPKLIARAVTHYELWKARQRAAT